MCQEVSPTQCDASEHSQNKSSYLISIKCLISTIFKETGQKEINVAVFFLCPPTLFFSIRRPGNLWHWLSSGVLPVSISDLEVWLRGSERNREREGEENSDNTKTGCSLCNPIASPKTSWPQPPPPPPHFSPFLSSFPFHLCLWFETLCLRALKGYVKPKHLPEKENSVTMVSLYFLWMKSGEIWTWMQLFSI